MADNVLGKGTYGMVKSVDGQAVKSFSRTSHLIQEYAAGLYLQDCPHIVKVLGADYGKQTMTMVQYKGSLKMWLAKPRTISQKMVMLREILLGLTWLNDLGLVHGDLKPGNVIANWDRQGNLTNVVIADLGFVAPERYSKAERTAPIYREKSVSRDFRHDIFSLGVICLESFGTTRIRKQTEHEELVKMAKTNINDEQMRKLVIRMLEENRRRRPTARYLLLKFFSLQPSIECLADLPSSHVRVPDIEKIFRQCEDGQKLSSGRVIPIKRAKIGYKACCYYLSSQKISKDRHLAYTAAMMVILSSIFGESGFSPEEATSFASCSLDSIHKKIDALLQCRQVLNYLYDTEKGCRSSE